MDKSSSSSSPRLIASSLSLDSNDPSIAGIYGGYNNLFAMQCTSEIMRSPFPKYNGKVQCYVLRDGNKLRMYLEVRTKFLRFSSG